MAELEKKVTELQQQLAQKNQAQPTAQTSVTSTEAASPAPPFVIALTKEGKATINDKELSDEALQVELKALANNSPQRAVVIKCHPASHNEHIAHKLRLCQKANLWNVSIATPPGESPPSPAE